MANKRRPPGRRSRAESARTRGRILDRAERLFARRGFRGTSLREIAAGCGVRPFTIQHHFASKAGLYQAALDRWDDELLARLSTALAGRRALPEVVEAAVDALFDFFLARRDWVALTARAALGEGLPEGVTLRDRSWLRFMDLALRERRLAAPRPDLRLLLISVEGLLNHHLLAREHYRQLYGRDVTDPRLRARVKAHVKTAILALVDHDRRRGRGGRR